MPKFLQRFAPNSLFTLPSGLNFLRRQIFTPIFKLVDRIFPGRIPPGVYCLIYPLSDSDFVCCIMTGKMDPLLRVWRTPSNKDQK